MCDTRNLNWCGRITLLVSICGILCVMMFQIWSYYFALVSQMDDLVLQSPSVRAILDLCDGQVNTMWNLDDCIAVGPRLTCELSSPTVDMLSTEVFVDAIGMHKTIANATHLSVNSSDCGRVLLWILPW